MQIDDQFWWGMALVPVLVLVYIGLGWLYVLSSRLWRKLHVHGMKKITLARSPIEFRISGDIEGPKEPYRESAERLVSSLSRFPSFRIFRGLGWFVVVGRDVKED